MVGLCPQIGILGPGSAAGIVIYDTNFLGKITHADSYGQTDYAAFEGFERIGIADQVYLRGRLMAERGQLVGEKGQGRYIRPKPYARCYDEYSGYKNQQG